MTNNLQSLTKKKSLSESEIKDLIVSYIAELLDIPPEQVDTTIEFDRYGLDSSAAIGLTGNLEDWLGEELDPTILYDYPTIETLTQYLSTVIMADKN